jgi:hypothetical protein
VSFEALEQTLRLRLVSGPVDKKFFFISRNSLSHTVLNLVKQKFQVQADWRLSVQYKRACSLKTHTDIMKNGPVMCVPVLWLCVRHNLDLQL